MFDINDEDIKELIDNYSKEKNMPYDLEYIVECGLKYIYGKSHYRNGKVEPCESSFSDFIHNKQIHKCKNHFLKTSLKKLSISDSLFSCWTGNNIAILSSDNVLHAYYKSEHLFEAQMQDISAMAASNAKIYLGTYSGNLIHYDPVSQSENIQERHSGAITSVRCVETPDYGNYVLSSSTDGSIFFRKKIQISSHEIFDSIYINSNHFICTCSDNSIAVYKSEELISFVGHKSRINTLSYDRIAVTTSSDGLMGLLSPYGLRKTNPLSPDDREDHTTLELDSFSNFEMRSIGCSLHKQLGSDKVLGFGMGCLKIYDIASDSALNVYSDETNNKISIESADMFNSVVVYGIGNAMNFRDIRTREKFRILTDSPIKNIEFNSTGDLLFVSSDDGPTMVELRV